VALPSQVAGSLSSYALLDRTLLLPRRVSPITESTFIKKRYTCSGVSGYGTGWLPDGSGGGCCTTENEHLWRVAEKSTPVPQQPKTIGQRQLANDYSLTV